jgi:hypothetical protein
MHNCLAIRSVAFLIAAYLLVANAAADDLFTLFAKLPLTTDQRAAIDRVKDEYQAKSDPLKPSANDFEGREAGATQRLELDGASFDRCWSLLTDGQIDDWTENARSHPPFPGFWWDLTLSDSQLAALTRIYSIHQAQVTPANRDVQRLEAELDSLSRHRSAFPVEGRPGTDERRKSRDGLTDELRETIRKIEGERKVLADQYHRAVRHLQSRNAAMLRELEAQLTAKQHEQLLLLKARSALSVRCSLRHVPEEQLRRLLPTLSELAQVSAALQAAEQRSRYRAVDDKVESPSLATLEVKRETVLKEFEEAVTEICRNAQRVRRRR